jgi:hypothetical protein
MKLSSALGAIGLAALKAEIRAAGRRIAIAALSGLLLFAAVGFAVAAFTVWLSGEIGTVWALVVMAGIFLLLLLIVQAVAQLAAGPRRRRRRPPPPPPSPPPAAAGGADPQASPEGVPPGSEIGSVGVVALLGFLLGRQLLQRSAGRRTGD